MANTTQITLDTIINAPGTHRLGDSILDLYCGPGCSSAGFELAGFTVAEAVDFTGYCLNTYRANHRGTKTHLMKVTDFLREKGLIRKDFEGILFRNGQVDKPKGIISGPPCKDYSIRNSKANIKSERAQQIFVAAKTIAILQPRFGMIENVATVPRHYKARVVDILEKAGYHVQAKVIQMADYGSVQIRKRWIATACKTRTAFPDPVQLNRTAREVLTDEQTSEWGHKQGTISHFKGREAGKWIGWNEGGYGGYFIVDPDKPLPALTDPSKSRFIHPSMTRYLTEQEFRNAIDLPGYEFTGTRTQIAEQIGLMWPATTARIFANSFAEALAA